MDYRRSGCSAGDVSGEKQRVFIPKKIYSSDSGIIEIEVDGVTIRTGPCADPTMIAPIVQALKASR